MTRYYCSGFDLDNFFGHGLGDMFKTELEDTKSIVYIPAGAKKIEKAHAKHIPNFTKHFKNVGIEFESVNIITPELSPAEAKDMIKNANFVMLMGGDPYKQKDLCKSLNILDDLKNYNGVMLGFSAGAMLMSKYIIITPCSDEFPNFHIEPGLDLDNISIYPHNNTSDKEYPDELVSGDEVYKKSDLLQVAKDYGKFYLLQDNLREDGLTDVSIIRSSAEKIEFYTENDGKIWLVDKDITLVKIMNRWTFDNDELFELVRDGRKRGTCSRNSDEEPMAKIGDVQEIYNSRGETIRIQITAVRKCRFCDIDDAWAKIEGEGDLSLAYWRTVHIDFFNKYFPDFQETDWLELNEFVVI